MTKRPATPAARLPHRVLFVLGAGAVGFVLNTFPVYVLGGLWLPIGQIGALASGLVFGPVAALLTAVFTLSGLGVAALTAASISLSQMVTWSVLALEAAAVAVLARRFRPVVALLVYWVCVGVPAIAFYSFAVRRMTPPDVAIVVGKNVMTGLFNILVASILVGRRPFGNPAESTGERQHSVVSMLNARVSSIVAVPVLLAMVVVSTLSQRTAEHAATERLRLESARSAIALDQYLQAHQRTVMVLAATVVEAVGESTSDRYQLLNAARRANPGFLTMLIADSSGRVLAVSSGAPGKLPPLSSFNPVSDRPYFTEAMRTALPFVSGAFLGRNFGRDVIAGVSAPMLGRDGRAVGVVEGSLNVKELSTIVGAPAGLDVTVVDRERHVVYSSAPQHHRILSSISPTIALGTWASGTGWSDDPRIMTSRRETYYAVAPAADGWSVFIEMPRYVALRSAEINGTGVFLACIMLFLASLIAVRFVNRAIVDPLLALESQAAALNWGGSLPEITSGPRIGAPPREIAMVGVALEHASRRINEAFFDTRRALADRDAALSEREETVRNLDAIVRERTRELTTERDRAQAASRAKSAFLANMSHELRTPLNVVLGRAEAFTEGVYGALSAPQQDALVEIDVQGRHLLALIDSILDLARVESGKLTVERRPVELRALLTEVVGSFLDISVRREVQLRLDAPASDAVVRADAFRLRQIIVNLVGNAMKFTPPRGLVTVSLEMAAGTGTPVAVHVWDTGIGIAPDRLPHIFDAFEQADTSSTRVHGGTGLGLTISQSLSTAMGMRISVTSRPGEGSTFTLHLNDAHAAVGADAVVPPDGARA